MTNDARWRVHGIVGEHVIWHDGEAYQATRDAVPGANHGGYPILESLLKLKNLDPRGVAKVPEEEMDVHVVKAPPYDGKPTWHGMYRTEDGWKVASSWAGPIAYADPGSARNGAKHFLEETMAPSAPGMR